MSTAAITCTEPRRHGPKMNEAFPATANAPRYQQLSAVLARELREGRYAVGSLQIGRAHV